MVDVAALVISLVLGFSLVLMFIYRLGIEERFDKAAVACLVGGLVLLGVATFGYGRNTSLNRQDDLAIRDVQTRLMALTKTADHVDGQVDAALSTASKALATATTAQDRASLAPSLQQLESNLTALRTELSQKTAQSPRKRKSPWAARMEGRIAGLESEIHDLRARGATK